MDTKELIELVNIFKEYRDLLVPLQNELYNFSQSFDGLKDNLNQISEVFDGDINGKLEQIYKTLYQQSQRSTDLSSRIDAFIKGNDKYMDTMLKFTTKLESVYNSMLKIEQLDSKAEEQINKLEGIIQEKKINYNIKDLQKSLESYNTNVQKVSEFINKDVAEKLQENNEKIIEVRNENAEIKKLIDSQSNSIQGLVEQFKVTSQTIKEGITAEGVNEEYLFEILDKWALSRKVKIK